MAWRKIGNYYYKKGPGHLRMAGSSPIEHDWKMMKDNLITRFPGPISALLNKENKAYFVNYVREAW